MSVRAKSLILTLAGAAMLAGPPAALPTGWITPATAAGLPLATDTRIGGDENQTRFVVDLSAKVGMRAFTLADPYRVVIDLPQVTFQLKPKAGESGRGLIKAFRFGLVMQGGSRIVLDLKKPVRIDKAFVLDTAEGQPARLVIDLTAVDRETFLRTIAQENRVAPQAQQRKSDQDASKQAERSPAADRARSRARGHRQWHPSPQRREREGPRARFCPVAARQN